MSAGRQLFYQHIRQRFQRPIWRPTMSTTPPPPTPNPWPLIHRVAFQANRIAAHKKIPYAAVIFQRHIQIIPRTAIGVGCTVLWTWTPTSLAKGMTFDEMANTETRFALALQHQLDDNPAIECPFDPDPSTPSPEELIL